MLCALVDGESPECCQFHNHNHHLPSNLFFMAMSQAPCWCCGGWWPSPRGRVRTRTSGSPGGRASLRILFRVRILSRSEHYQDQNIIKINILFKKSKPENTDKCISSLRNLFGRFQDFSLVSHARVHSNQPKLFNSSLPLMFLPNSLKYENFSAYSFDPSEFQPGKENRTKS